MKKPFNHSLRTGRALAVVVAAHCHYSWQRRQKCMPGQWQYEQQHSPLSHAQTDWSRPTVRTMHCGREREKECYSCFIHRQTDLGRALKAGKAEPSPRRPRQMLWAPLFLKTAAAKVEIVERRPKRGSSQTDAKIRRRVLFFCVLLLAWRSSPPPRPCQTITKTATEGNWVPVASSYFTSA